MAEFDNKQQQDFEGQDQFEERVIEIARVAKVVKGGRRFQFRVTVVVGDKRGTISMGVGKANAVPDAMRKASERARKNMRVVNLAGTTIMLSEIRDFGDRGLGVIALMAAKRNRAYVEAYYLFQVTRGWRGARVVSVHPVT